MTAGCKCRQHNISLPNYVWYYQEGQKHKQHSRVRGPLPNRRAPVICTGCPLLVGTGPMRFGIHTAMNIVINVSWNLTPCGLENMYESFGETCRNMLIPPKPIHQTTRSYIQKGHTFNAASCHACRWIGTHHIPKYCEYNLLASMYSIFCVKCCTVIRLFRELIKYGLCLTSNRIPFL